MLIKKVYTIDPNIILKLKYYNYKIARVVLREIYNMTFSNRKAPLKKQLSFWSTFVNKNYIIVVEDNIYTSEDIKILRREIELVSDFELDKCGEEYIIRQKNK